MTQALNTDTPLSPQKAIDIARSRVSIVSNGARQWTVHTWSPKHNATWMSHSMPIEAAKLAAYEDRVRIALELLEIEDAGALANMAAHDGMSGYRLDWRKVVRDLASKHRQV